jgi:hypothetical protein
VEWSEAPMLESRQGRRCAKARFGLRLIFALDLVHTNRDLVQYDSLGYSLLLSGGRILIESGRRKNGQKQVVRRRVVERDPASRTAPCCGKRK